MTFHLDRSRLILLGASNLTRAFATVVHNAQRVFGAPLDIYAALGHGRSYGMHSSIALGARALPGIVDCRLWDALRETSKSQNVETSKRQHIETSNENRADDDVVSTFRRFDVSTFALITDIGNDIMYGAAPGQIADWVETCVQRLRQQQARIAITMLPIETIRRVSRWQFAIVKAVMFPTRSLTFEQAMKRADELHERVTDLAHRHELQIVTPDTAWYGFDPIHIRHHHWPDAWGAILGACAQRDAQECRPCARPPLLLWPHLKTAMPDRWWFFGIPLGQSQPARTLRDGSRVSLY